MRKKEKLPKLKVRPKHSNKTVKKKKKSPKHLLLKAAIRKARRNMNLNLRKKPPLRKKRKQ